MLLQGCGHTVTKITLDCKSPPSFDKQADKFCSLPFSEILGESVSTSGNLQ